MSASLPSTSPSPAPSATPQYDLTEAALEQLVPDGGDTSSSIIRTLADAFLSLHDRLPGSISYSALIVLLTLVLRSSITLPLTVWSRRRVRRVAELVVPRVKAWSARAKYALRAEYRKENRSYEDYVKELNARVSADVRDPPLPFTWKRVGSGRQRSYPRHRLMQVGPYHSPPFTLPTALLDALLLPPPPPPFCAHFHVTVCLTSKTTQTKQQFKRLTKEYSCRPLPTMLLPPLIHLPVFITSTLVLREACNKSALAFSAAGGTSSTSDSVAGAALALAASHDALSPASPSSLATLAAESLAWCPSLAEVDPNTYLPAAVALTALANVEIQAALRARLASLQSEAASGDSAVVGTDSGRAAASLSATIGQQQQPSRPAPKRASIVRPARVVPAALQKRSVSSSAAHGFSPSNVVAMPLPSTSSTPSAMENSRTSSPPPPPFPSASAIRSKAITNVLRFGSLVFLPVAAYAPVVSRYRVPRRKRKE